VTIIGSLLKCDMAMEEFYDIIEERDGIDVKGNA
jgi:hypothetical protein